MSVKGPGNNTRQQAQMKKQSLREDGSPPVPTKDASSHIVDPQVLAAIELAIQPVLTAQANIQASQRAMSTKLDDALEELTAVRAKVSTLETAAQFSSDRMESLVSTTLPDVTTHITSIANALAMRQLEMDVHQRKWALVIDGVKGVAEEKEYDTRKACLTMADQQLKVPNTKDTGISACHRLSTNANSPIYIRFTDLQQRNSWLSHAKNLAGKNSSISISPDLPPVLRKLKKDLLDQRKKLDENIRKKSSIKYLRQWPFLILKIKDHDDLAPNISKQSIVNEVLGFNAHMEIRESIDVGGEPDKWLVETETKRSILID